MTTTHVYNNNDQLMVNVRNALRQVHNRDNYLRVITCGKAVVILPDTDRTKDCEMPEMLKAMGLVAVKDSRNLVCPAPAERKNVLCLYEGEVQHIYSLTPDQIRLLDELQENDYLNYHLSFSPVENCEVRTI
jgi:hypothetical protein